MTYKPNLIKGSDSIIDAKKWAVGIITTFLGLGMFLSELQRIKDILFEPLMLGYLLLFLTNGVLVFLWIWATKKELDLCFIWLDPERYEPPSSLKETIMIVGLGILLSILFFVSRDPLFFGIVFTLYSITVTYTNYYAKNEINSAIIGSKQRLEKEIKNEKTKLVSIQYLKGLNALEDYFIKRPQTIRHLWIIGFCLISLVFGVLWKFTNSEIYGIISYSISFLIILFSEIIIAQWRIYRDNCLRPIKAEINELTRN